VGQALALHATQQVLLGTLQILKDYRRGVDDRIPNLFSCLPGTRPGVSLLHGEESGTVGRHGQHVLQLRVAALEMNCLAPLIL